MPERSEVAIMAEYINDVTQKLTFTTIKRTAHHKSSADVSLITHPFQLHATTRGKEMKLTLSTGETLMANMGMTGSWALMPTATLTPHTHLWFVAGEQSLGMIDPRRFGNFWWGDFDYDKRSPDPVTEHEAWVQHLTACVGKKIFQKPIMDLMLDQKYFNGVGNYVRCEILDRAEIDPYTPAKDVVLRPDFQAMTKWVFETSYQIGGGQLKDWKSPYQKDKAVFGEWLQCYKKKSYLERHGRFFWLDPKWIR